MKKSLIFTIAGIGLATAVLVALGFVYDQPDYEKQQGLTGVYDVAADGTIAYVAYEKGQAGIYLKNDQADGEPILQLAVGEVITDLDFSPDGSALAYAVANEDMETVQESAVYVLSVQSLNTDFLFSEKTIITELEFDPQDSQRLFYLQAGTFENYSPIASARPHEVDVYSYDLRRDEHAQHTNMKKYSMNSLNISSAESAVFVQMDDDREAKTADDGFYMKQRIFKISLDSPEQPTVVSNSEEGKDLYDFVVLPEEDFIYQAISNPNQGGTFEYELFYYDNKKKQETQLTYLKHNASRPLLGPGDTVYFMVDRKFGQSRPEYHLYRMDMDGKNLKEVSLEQRQTVE